MTYNNLYIVSGYTNNIASCGNPTVKSFLFTHDYKIAKQKLDSLLKNNIRPTGVSNSFYGTGGCYWIKTILIDMDYEKGEDMRVPDPIEKDT